MIVLSLSGCGVTDAVHEKTGHDTGAFGKILEQVSNGQSPTYSDDNDYLKDSGVEAEAEELIYDARTGLYLTKAEIRMDNIVYNIKLYGFYIMVFCVLIGFFIRRVQKESVTFQRLGLVLEVAVPIAYLFLSYGMSYIADRI